MLGARRGWVGWGWDDGRPQHGGGVVGFGGSERSCSRIEGGEIGAPVGEMNITGNYLELLPNLTLVGNDPEPWATVKTPTLAFESVQFSGS